LHKNLKAPLLLAAVVRKPNAVFPKFPHTGALLLWMVVPLLHVVLHLVLHLVLLPLLLLWLVVRMLRLLLHLVLLQLHGNWYIARFPSPVLDF
jgi:hypothetical protein